MKAALVGPVAACLAAGIAGGGLVLVVTAVPAIALAAAAAAGAIPVVVRRRRAEARSRAERVAWPDAIDMLASGVRAGLSLPEAVAAVGASGPDPLRPAFTVFAVEYRVSGSFATAMDALSASITDRGSARTGYRVRAALTVAVEVGGADLGVVLRTLSHMLREEARIRGEIEARQSWTVAAARLAVAAPFVTALLLSMRPEAGRTYATAGGTLVLGCAALLSLLAYLLMRRIARLPEVGEVGA